jgi:hypothetical protein
MNEAAITAVQWDLPLCISLKSTVSAFAETAQSGETKRRVLAQHKLSPVKAGKKTRPACAGPG